MDDTTEQKQQSFQIVPLWQFEADAGIDVELTANTH